MDDGNPVAVKKQIYDKSNDLLEHEAKVLKCLEKMELFPKFFKEIYDNEEIYIIQTIEGPNVGKLWNFCNKCKKLDIYSVYSFGIEI